MSSLYSVQPLNPSRMSADHPLESSLSLEVSSEPAANTQGLEVAIKNPKKKYQDKVSALLSGWERLASLASGSPAAVNSLAECLYRDTLTLVLKGHWPKLLPATKTHLSVTLQRCVSSLISPSALKKCRDLIGLVHNPWGNPTLTEIFNNPEEIDDAKVIEFCLSEKDSMLFVRLETLCDSKCEDLALKLARACLRCLKLSDTRFRDVCTPDELNYILDLYIFLLYKFKNVQEIINELKHLDLKEGLALIRRYSATKNVNIPPRLWKNSQKVAELAAQYFLAVAMVKPVTETVGLLKELMTEWAILHSRDEAISENLANMIRKLIQPAESALHVYIFIEVLVDKFGYGLKSLCIELYIRGLTMDMNELEHQKVVGDEDKVKETEVRLSYGFQKLADLLKDNLGVSRECILTAFSLYPTEGSYKQIQEMALASGKIRNCSPQLVLRKRKTKIPLKGREDRMGKSTHRRKVARALESESTCNSPSTVNISMKKCSTEAYSGTVNTQTLRRTFSQNVSLSEGNSPVFSDNNGVNDRVNASVRNVKVMEVIGVTSQTDRSSQFSGEFCTSSVVDDVTVSMGKNNPQMLESSPTIRSRSGVLKLLEADADFAPVSFDVNKRSRSRYLNEEMSLVSSSKTDFVRCRYRSGDAVSQSSCLASSAASSLRKRSLHAVKCFCEGCEAATRKVSYPVKRKRSISGNAARNNSFKNLSKEVNNDAQTILNHVGAKSMGSIDPVQQNLLFPSAIVPQNQLSNQLENTLHLELMSHTSDDKLEVVGRKKRRSRSLSLDDNITYSGSKLCRIKSCSIIASTMASHQKRLGSQGVYSEKNTRQIGLEKHKERCRACFGNLCDTDSTSLSCDHKESVLDDSCKNCPPTSACAGGGLTCKVCNHPHDANNSKLYHYATPKGEEEMGQSSDIYKKTSLNYDVLSAPNEVLDAEKLGLTSQLCDDLAVVLSSPRWHMLSWVLDWSQLSTLCERYLRDRESMRNVTKELKYLNIDYNQFKDRPSAIDSKDEYCGIEKGYEHWVDMVSDHSDQEYEYSSSYKKSGSAQSHEDTDSDSSVLSQRQKSVIISPDSSQSELDFKVKKIRKKPFRSLSISDSDTGTQDSRTDSLGSDGCYKEKPKRKVPESRRKKTPLVKRIAEKRLNDLSKFRLIVNDDICKDSHNSTDLSNNAKEVMTIFSQVGDSGKKSSTKQYCHTFNSSPSSNLVTDPEVRRDKDAKTLKSLRMFRPNHLKSVLRDKLCYSSSSESAQLKTKSSDDGMKFAPMLSTLNLNPRILLTRADVSSHYLKSKNVNSVIVKNSSLNSQPATKSNGINSKNSQCLSDNNLFAGNKKSTFTKSHKRALKKMDGLRSGFELITQAVIESQLLARTVPGLNSLDMMVPPPSEPMVQVIQLPHNPPSTSGSHGSTTPAPPQKVTATQGVQTSSNISPQKVTATQGVQTSPISASQKSTVTQGVQISPGINPVGGEPGPSSISHHSDEHWKTVHVGVSASESTSHNISLTTSPGESTFAGVVMEGRFFPQSSIPNTVTAGTPVTAHIQRVGQPPVGLDGDTVLGSSSLRRIHQCPPQLLSGTAVPIVKGVSLDIVANLRAEALRNADIAESLSTSVGTPRSLQISGPLDPQKVLIASKKVPQTNASETKMKHARVQKVDEDSQTDNVGRGSVLTAVEEGSGQTFILTEDGVSKLVGPGKKGQCVKATKSSLTQLPSLPKFQQAFGKTIYASNTPGAVESANRTQSAALEEEPGTSGISSSVNVTEKLEILPSSGSVLSKGIQTTSLENTSMSKSRVNLQTSTNSSSTEPTKAVSCDVLSRSVPSLCAVPSVASVATQSEASSGLSSSNVNFPSSPATAGTSVSRNSVSSDSSPVSQKISVATSSQVIGTIGEVNQSNQPQQHQITIPMKLSMVSLNANLSEKEVTLRNKMTELLNRALQRNVISGNSCSSAITPSTVSSVIQEKTQEDYASANSEEMGSESIESPPEQEESRITNPDNIRCVIQSPRTTRPLIEIAVEENTSSPVPNHSVTIQAPIRSQHAVASHVSTVLCNTSSNSPVMSPQVSQNVEATNTLMPHNAMHPNVSSTTLEQLREFESVLEQVTNTSQMKERKSVLTPTESETANDLTQQLLLSQTSTPSNSTDFDSSNTPSTSFSRESFPSSPPTTPPKAGSTSFAGQSAAIQGNSSSQNSTRISSTTPVVVVTSYSQPIASPALSVTSQSSSSPNVTPASTPGKTPPKSSPKNSKSKSMKTTPTTTSKTTPVTKPQQKPQEDEETAQRIYAILDQYAEQLKNSPDLINKPAPRRRSNPPINPIGSSKRKKSTPTKLRLSGHPPVLTESSPGGDDPRTAGSEDSSSGITQLPQVHDSPVPNSDDTMRSTPTHESPTTFQLRRTSNVETCESRDANRSTHTSTDTSNTQSQSTDTPSQETASLGAVPVATPSQPSSGTVVAGKSLVVGSATALPLYVPGSVRQVLFPVASGITASVQGRPVVVTKGSKVIRVHQVTVAGGSPMLAGAVAGAKPLQVATGTAAVQGALVVRQMCVNKSGVSSPSVSSPQVSPLTMVGTTNAVKQLKLPVMQAVAGGISSQTLAGVTAQPPVVLPPGSHPLTAAPILPPNFTSGAQGVPSVEDSKETTGTSMHEDDPCVSTSLDLLQFNGNSSQEKTSESISSSVSPLNSKTEAVGEVTGVNDSERVSPKTSSGVKTLSVGCETDSHPDVSLPAIARNSIPSISVLGCVNPTKSEVENKKLVEHLSPINSFGDCNVNVISSLENTSVQSVEPNNFSSPINVINPHFQETVLVENSAGKVSPQKEETLSVLQCIDPMNPGKSGMIGNVSNTFLESVDTRSRTCTEQNLLVGPTVIQSGSSKASESRPDVCCTLPPSASQVPGNAIDCSRGIPSNQCTLTSSTGPPCSTFLPKENHEKLGLQQSSVSPTYQRDEKKPDLSLDENIAMKPLKKEANDNVASGMKEKLPSAPLKSIGDTTSLESTSIDGGKNLVLDTVNVPQKLPKTMVPGADDLTKVIPPDVKCEERSSEDELEKGLSRTLSGSNTTDYCFSLKRPSSDSKTSDSPWRYVPVVKRVSVSHGKPVPVESALMRSHVESEACLNLPRITDSLPDELKGGESDDGCRSNFPSSMGTSHTGKRRLFSDEVLEYSSYSGSKKQEKIKQRIEKINRAADSIEREFRQTRLELEKELRLQKSLSEECEDLGVDEPSTSDLFPEADLLLDPNPSPSFDQTMPDTPCAQTMDSSEPFSSSDFRSVDSSSSAEGVHETAGCSKSLNVSGNKSVQRKEKPVPARPRKYLLRHRTDKKKWISVRNHHGTLEYRKASKDDDQRKPPLPRSPRTTKGDVSAGPLNGSSTMSQTNLEMSTFTSSSGEDSSSRHSLSPIKATTHTSPPTFSSDMTYSPPQDEPVTSPKSHTSQTFDLSSTPSAAQRTNITYSKKGQSYAKDYSNTGPKHSRVYQFLDYLCEQGDSRDSCESWESSNSMEKESTSESSKCGRSYHGIKDAGSPSSSPEEDDDGKSIPDYQDPSANHTSFSNLLQISNPSKLSKEMEETVLEGMEDDNAILPSANGIECDDEDKGGQKKSPLEKSLRKQAMEKNAKKHVLDKIDLYPRVCLKKWKGKDSITCSRYALELENVSAMPTGSKHFTCIERPLLESESSVSSEPSSENSSKTSIEQNIAVGHLELSKSIVLGKDGEFNIQSDCPNQSSVLNSSRRSSLRGHVKKGCPCCNGSPEPKKSRVFKGDKISKKIHSSSKPCSKLHMTKKR